jgi:imidazolonepropionase-like amidohydrolase
MVRGGMTPLAALQTATINPARHFGLEQTAGNVASGRRADLVLRQDSNEKGSSPRSFPWNDAHLAAPLATDPTTTFTTGC